MKASRIKMSVAKNRLYAPVLAPVLQNRWLIAVLGAAALFQTAATAMGLAAWQCPIKSALGVTCPGCGLTRAIVYLMQGKWQAAINLHAFAPVAAAIGLLLATGSLLPAKMRKSAARHLAAIEIRSGIVVWLALGALVYWIGRLTMDL